MIYYFLKIRFSQTRIRIYCRYKTFICLETTFSESEKELIEISRKFLLAEIYAKIYLLLSKNKIIFNAWATKQSDLEFEYAITSEWWREWCDYVNIEYNTLFEIKNTHDLEQQNLVRQLNSCISEVESEFKIDLNSCRKPNAILWRKSLNSSKLDASKIFNSSKSKSFKIYNT